MHHLLGGRYLVGPILGYGRMAEVHRGRDLRLGRDVAIKVLRPELATNAGSVNRFQQEAEQTASLNHPFIVSVFDTGEDSIASGKRLPYIVMELIEGEALSEVLSAKGTPHHLHALEIVRDVCAALAHSHANGIVHRDLKLSNVMLSESNQVKVMDFGIARARLKSGEATTANSSDLHTAFYMSPEQARGETVDARSDLYSVGCLLFELLCGQPPFVGYNPVGVAYEHVRSSPPTPSSRGVELGPEVDQIVLTALTKNPDNRYQSAEEMGHALSRAIDNIKHPSLAKAHSTGEASSRTAERAAWVAEAPLMTGDLVFIHGFWSSSRTWDTLVRSLEADTDLQALNVLRFGYESPKLSLPFSWTRIPDYDDIAQSLLSYLSVYARGDIAIVTHSQGGLILQRFLAWMLNEGRGRELARIKIIVMLACPNDGSDYLRSIRTAAGFGRHAQARDLKALSADVAAAHRIVLRQIVNASSVDDRHCPIPIYVYAGRTDRVVVRVSAQGGFSNAGTLPGDHFSILNSEMPDNLTVPTLKAHLAEAFDRRDATQPPPGGAN